MVWSGALRRRAMSLLAAVCLVWACLAAGAIEVWTPQTGEVDLDEPVGPDVRSRLRHAYALIGARQWAGAIPQLRKLLKESPDAAWAGEARLMLGRALMQAQNYEGAFEELSKLTAGYPEDELAVRAHQMQYEAAQRASGKHLGSALRMYDRLAETAADEAEMMDALRRKGDAIFERGNYLRAQNEYLALTSFDARGEWAPYCWYRVAQCRWRLANWLGLGLERVRRAERAFADFVELYPDHNLTSKAQEELAEVRRRRAEMNARVAQFYDSREDRPWAALNYLRYIVEEFPESPQSEWAEWRMRRIEEEMNGPARGERQDLPLPGVETTE